MKKLLKGPLPQLPEDKGGKVKLEGVYETYMGRRAGMSVWVVNWHFVASKLWSEFLMGGNDQRYKFNPLNEVWMDSTMGIEEWTYTLEHEVLERNMMRDYRWTYDQAHDYATAQLDGKMRADNNRRIERKLKKLQKDEKFSPLTDKLAKVYRCYFGKRNGTHIWIVDGPRVREHLWQDFGLPGGSDIGLEFVPPGEIWLDNATSCSVLHYALTQEMAHRRFMQEGMNYGDAFTRAVQVRELERIRQDKLCRKHEAGLPPMEVGARDRGSRHIR